MDHFVDFIVRRLRCKFFQVTGIIHPNVRVYMLAEECKERRLPVEDIFLSLGCLAVVVRCWLGVRGGL